MNESFSNVSSYNHALDSHREYTTTVQGTGLFDARDRLSDELELRETVGQYLTHHTGTAARQLRTEVESLVPLYDSYAEECVEGYLPASLAGKLASKSMLHYGLHGDFTQMDGVFQAYRSALEVMSVARRIVAKQQLLKTTIHSTPLYADRLSVMPESDESVQHYRQTMRRLLGRGALTDDVYVRRMQEANLRPAPTLLRKLRPF